jgi:hypothetical protein
MVPTYPAANVVLVLIGVLLVLVRKLPVQLDGVRVDATPMLVPSISSRATNNIINAVETISGIISGPALISAYDQNHADILSFIEPACNLIFIDSGGYECEIGYKSAKSKLYNLDLLEWNEEYHLDTIKNFSKTPTKVIISFDHPNLREPLEDQISRANKLFKQNNGFLREFLIKPENKDDSMIDIEKIIQNIKSFNMFDVIGIIEKELGPTILDRMVAIATLRSEMDRKGIIKPLHVFGSLDTITTPLYYFSGADIFDGLAWSRHIFHDGKTLYRDSFGPSLKGIQAHMNNILISTLIDNFNYLLELRLELEQFESTKKFEIFGNNFKFFERSYEKLYQKMGGNI